MITAYVLLADGFEEIEAVAPIGILRRAGVSVTTFGVSNLQVTSARGITLVADTVLTAMPVLPDLLVLPGGEPGASTLENTPLVTQLVLAQHAHKKWLAAICAAPRILARLGLLEGHFATAFPGVRDSIPPAVYRDLPVVVSGHIVTGRGAGVALDFSYTLLSCLYTPVAADNMRETMGCSRS